ncbi:MAG: hypothetical protein QW231_01040 [Candidatus Bathyarchaeia archaeon]
MRGFRDRDFLRTKEGFFFCVVGPVHPPDRVISYVKYVPADLGKWGKGRERFRRILESYTIPSLLETFNMLTKDYPHYLFYSEVFKITMSAVPLEYIAEHYKPEEKLAHLLQAPRLDLLQRRLVEFASFLSKKGGVPLDFLGVTGSILLDIHRPEFSDLDLTVYGLENSLAIRKVLTEAYSQRDSTVQRLRNDALKTWCKHKAQRYPLTFNEALRIYERKWNIGVFRGTPFSVHPVKLEHKVKERYGDRIYKPLGQVTLRALVHENADCLFLPAVYGVRDAEIMEGPKVKDIREVVSYEGLYDNLARLERVTEVTTGQEYYRVLVGSPEGRGTESIKLL